MTLDASILDDTAPRSARLVALSLVEDLARERDRLAAERGSETLHDFRVALRRLRSWLRLLAPSLEGSLPKACVRRLRRMARESNAGRDAEVFLAWLRTTEGQLSTRDRPAVQWLIERFQRQEREAESELEARLKRDFQRTRERLEERLSTYRVEAHVHGGVREALFSTVIAALLRELAEDLRRRLKRVRSVDDANEAHQARITGKRLRYLIEPIAQHVAAGPVLLAQLRGLQDVLGDLHDAHVWLLVLRHVVAELAMEEGRRMTSSLTTVQRGRKRSAESKGPPRSGLISLARLAHERAVTAFERFSADWGEGKAKAFYHDIVELAERLDARTLVVLEIERKFLLKRLPEKMPSVTVLNMEQGYLPGDRLIERLRAVEVGRRRTYLRTVKVGAGLVRSELEEETSAEVFRTMWPLTKGKRLSKRRHRVPQGDLTWDIDEFTDRELVLAEIELPSADTPVEIPDWLEPWVDREVTGDSAYLNWTLAK
ncbi:MAG TPA: CHAD domain-containing protein [Gemmatimonadaceae bacterium]